MNRVETSILVNAPPEALFAFHEDPQNLIRVLPPYLRLRIVKGPRKLRRGSRLGCVMFVGPLRFDWNLEIVEYTPPHRFVDVQQEGPFQSYVHTHMIERGRRGTLLTDIVDYELPPGPLAELAGRIGFRHRLQDVLEHAQKVTRKLLERRS